MSWKFWQKQKLAMNVAITDKEWPEKLRRFKERLANTPDTDPTMVGVMALLDAFVRTELPAVVSSGLDNAEANRLRGRVGMLLDFKAELLKVWQDAQREAKSKDS